MAGQNIALELQEGRRLLQSTVRSDRAGPDDVAQIEQVLASFEILRADAQRLALLSSDAVAAVMSRGGLRTNLSYYKVLEISPIARPWRSALGTSFSRVPNQAIPRATVIARLRSVRDLGFDVLYFPPIHPIGKTHRKGPQQQPQCRTGRRRQPLCHRLRTWRARCHPTATGALRGFPSLGGCCAAARAGGRDRLCDSGFSRPPLD